MAVLAIAGVAPYGVQGMDWMAGMGQVNVVEFSAALHGEDQLRRRLPDRAGDGDPAAGWTQGRRRVVAEVYTVHVHHEPGEELWAEVLELPGCFAAGADMKELREALSEAISLYLSESGDVKHIELEDEPGSVTEHRMLARTA